MKEIEKMLKGKWYDANFDQELLVMRQKAELNCFDFNMSKPGSDEQLFALRKLLRNKLPKGLTMLAPVYFDYGKYTYFSEDVFINHGCYFMDGGSITIGKNTFVGPFCGFYTSNHPLNYADRNKGLEQAL